MVKNILLGVLGLGIIIFGGLLFWEVQKTHALRAQLAVASKMPPAGPTAKRSGRAPIILSKGTNLKTTPLFQYAFQIAPGDLSDSAKKALVGWTITTEKKSDGSVVVTLTPKDSDDQDQQYTVKSGQVLYFIEQTPADDKSDLDTDLNYRDDYGIVTDASGLIQ